VHADQGPQAPGGNICSWFLQGNCRFGDNCRFQHTGGDGLGGSRGQHDWRSGGGWKGQGKGEGFSAPSRPREPTGPYLGKGSELLKVWSMPSNQGHEDGIDTAILMGEQLCTGGRDAQLMVWSGQTTSYGLSLVKDNDVRLPAAVTALFYHAESKWLFCGLSTGQIQAYRQQPPAQALLVGHTATVTSLLVHQMILLSGSSDASIRAWRYQEANGSFECVTTVQSPLGEVLCIHLQLPGGLWVGAQRGISCVSLETMQPVGNIECPAPVVKLLPYEGSVVVALANGVVKVFDAAGNQQFTHGPLGDHVTNTSAVLMQHPIAGKTLLICGQEFGYATAYEFPDFRPRGSFRTGFDGPVTSIVDMGAGGVFVTCGLSGDVVIWRWSQPSNG